jgi:hypothetical protein
MLKFRTIPIVLPILFFSVLMSHNVNAQSIPDGLIGLSSSEPAVLYSIDESTGIATPLVTLNGNASITGLAFLHRTLYGTDLYDFPGSTFDQNAIGSISKSGIISFLSNQNDSQNWWCLASDEAGDVLYSVDNDNSDILTAQFRDGSVKTIGSGVGFGVPGLEFDNIHGILYAISTDKSLYTISTENGTASLIGPTGISGHSTNDIGLAYDACSQILYANEGDLHQLYILDVTTGAATLVGSNGVGDVIDGLAWKGPCGVAISNPIPTLSEWGMIAAAAGLGFVGVFFALKRRKAQQETNILYK